MVVERSARIGEEDGVRLYLNDIARHPLLTKADEAELAGKIRLGREAAAELASGTDDALNRQIELRRAIQEGDEASTRFVKSNLRLSLIHI